MLKNNERLDDLQINNKFIIQNKTDCKDITLVEIQEYMADMSRRSVEYNNQQDFIRVVNAPLQGIHKQIGLGCYSVVVCNPPYKDCGVLNEKQSICIAKHEIEVNLEEIIEEASKLLKFGGRLYLVNREERLTDILVYSRKYNIEPKILKILPSSKGDSIILVEGKKGGKSGIRIRLG